MTKAKCGFCRTVYDSGIVLFLGIMMMMNTSLYAQRKFNENPGGFLEEMTVFLEEGLKKDKVLREEAEALMITYTAEWDFTFTLEQQMMVIHTCNLMLKKKMAPHPYFLQYLPLVLKMAQSKPPEQSYLAWNRAMDHILENKSRDFRPFLSFTDALISRNLIYESNITQWKVSAEDYFFTFDNNTLQLVFPLPI